MAAAHEGPIRFRCYKCNKLLGVSGRKAGLIVSCPECQSELQVPRPETVSEPSGSGSVSAPTSDAEAVAEATAEPQAGSTSYPEVLISAGVQVRPPAPPPPLDPEPILIPDPIPSPSPIPAVAVDDALLTSIQVEAPSIRREPASSEPRPQDVVLSPVIVLAWSLLVLMAVPLAFLAGLLTGHFVWK